MLYNFDSEQTIRQNIKEIPMNERPTSFFLNTHNYLANRSELNVDVRVKFLQWLDSQTDDTLANKKILVIKELRGISGLGLLEAKAVVDGLFDQPFWPKMDSNGKMEEKTGQGDVYLYGVFNTLAQLQNLFLNKEHAEAYCEELVNREKDWMSDTFFVSEVFLLQEDISEAGEKNRKREAALAKLTAEDREVLGL